MDFLTLIVIGYEHLSMFVLRLNNRWKSSADEILRVVPWE